MKKIDNNTFVKKYILAKTDEEKHLLLKNHMLSMSFEELMDWNNFLSDNIDVLIAKNIKDGLTSADKEFYRQQFPAGQGCSFHLYTANQRTTSLGIAGSNVQ